MRFGSSMWLEMLTRKQQEMRILFPLLLLPVKLLLTVCERWRGRRLNGQKIEVGGETRWRTELVMLELNGIERSRRCFLEWSCLRLYGRSVVGARGWICRGLLCNQWRRGLDGQNW